MLDMIEDNLEFIFLGMPSAFSIQVLEGLLRAGKRPIAVIIPGSDEDSGVGIRQLRPHPDRSELPLLRPYLQEGIAQLAWEHDIAVFAVRDFSSDDTIEQIAALQAAVGIVACFPLRVPEEILAIPQFGFLNLHPSLLPAYRGPFPLFWTIRHGVQESGITLHHVDSGLDTGDIALQAEIIIPDGVSSREVDLIFATEGTNLVLEALVSLANGDLARRTQGAGASYFGRPSEADFAIPTDWTARRAFNFIRGTDEWQLPYRIEGAGFNLATRSALAYESEGKIDVPFIRQGDESWIMFEIGVLHTSNW